MEILRANITYLKAVVEISQELFKKTSLKRLEEEYANALKNKNSAIFLLIQKSDVVGFAHCQLRFEYVEGAHSNPVGYLEAIYIKSNVRKQGYSRKLIKSCEEWAKKKGCTELASDSELDNLDSYHFHLSSGFVETSKIICYTKRI